MHDKYILKAVDVRLVTSASFFVFRIFGTLVPVRRQSKTYNIISFSFFGLFHAYHMPSCMFYLIEKSTYCDLLYSEQSQNSDLICIRSKQFQKPPSFCNRQCIQKYRFSDRRLTIGKWLSVRLTYINVFVILPPFSVYVFKFRFFKQDIVSDNFKFCFKNVSTSQIVL